MVIPQHLPNPRNLFTGPVHFGALSNHFVLYLNWPPYIENPLQPSVRRHLSCARHLVSLYTFCLLTKLSGPPVLPYLVKFTPCFLQSSLNVLCSNTTRLTDNGSQLILIPRAPPILLSLFILACMCRFECVSGGRYHPRNLDRAIISLPLHIFFIIQSIPILVHSNHSPFQL